jgi:hypothetical protein
MVIMAIIILKMLYVCVKSLYGAGQEDGATNKFRRHACHVNVFPIPSLYEVGCIPSARSAFWLSKI